VTFTEDGDALIEALRPNGSIEELRVLPADEVPSALDEGNSDDETERDR
jgi:hypothetical protein